MTDTPQTDRHRSSTAPTFVPDRHTLATRLFHAALAISVIVQLVTSYTMHRPRNGAPGDLAYRLHEVDGLLALLLAFVFWLTVMARSKGTRLAALIPWLSPARRAAVWGDLALHMKALAGLRLPPHGEDGPLASAIHGLGLMLISAMTLTGAYWYGMSLFGLGRAAYVHLFLEVHKLLGNLAWAYLIGHAGLALIQHLSRNMPLGVMWSLRK